MILRGYSPDFFERSHAFERFLNSHHPQSFHSLGDRLVFNHRGRSSLDDQAPDRLAHWKCFNQSRAAEITAPFTAVASRSPIKNRVFVIRERELLNQFRLRHELFLTISAAAPNKSLRERHTARAGNQQRPAAQV